MISATVQCLLAFMLPAWLAARLCGRHPAGYLGLCRAVAPRQFAGTLLLLLLMTPAMNAVIGWNENVSLPTSMSGLEETMRNLENSAAAPPRRTAEGHDRRRGQPTCGGVDGRVRVQFRTFSVLRIRSPAAARRDFRLPVSLHGFAVDSGVRPCVQQLAGGSSGMVGGERNVADRYRHRRRRSSLAFGYESRADHLIDCLLRAAFVQTRRTCRGRRGKLTTNLQKTNDNGKQYGL